MMVPILLIWAFLPYLAAPVVQFIGEQMVNIMYKLPYNRNLEYEADHIGLSLAAKVCNIMRCDIFWQRIFVIICKSIIVVSYTGLHRCS